MLNSAWVTESWKSRARLARSSLAASGRRLAAQILLQPLALPECHGPIRGRRRNGPSTTVATMPISTAMVPPPGQRQVQPHLLLLFRMSSCMARHAG